MSNVREATTAGALGVVSLGIGASNLTELLRRVTSDNPVHVSSVHEQMSIAELEVLTAFSAVVTIICAAAAVTFLRR